MLDSDIIFTRFSYFFQKSITVEILFVIRSAHAFEELIISDWIRWNNRTFLFLRFFITFFLRWIRVLLGRIIIFSCISCLWVFRHLWGLICLRYTLWFWFSRCLRTLLIFIFFFCFLSCFWFIGASCWIWFSNLFIKVEGNGRTRYVRFHFSKALTVLICYLVDYDNNQEHDEYVIWFWTTILSSIQALVSIGREHFN